MVDVLELHMTNTSLALNIDHRDGEHEVIDLTRIDHFSNQQDLLPECLCVEPRAQSLPSIIVNRRVSTLSRLPFFSPGVANLVVHPDGALMVPNVLVEIDLCFMRCSPIQQF